MDSRFHENWTGAQAAGLARGAYHVYVTEGDPVEQAAFFLETVDHPPARIPKPYSRRSS